MKKILITGISGFLGSHTAIAALNKGYEVVGTIRDIRNADRIKAIIGKHTNQIQNLSIAEADLLDNLIWDSLTKNVEGVLHIASPFPRVLPKNEEDLIKPAKNGTLNILEAAAKNRVKKVVLTSSIGSIAYGKDVKTKREVYDEGDWTNENNKKDTTPYYRSKTVAEKAAWDFIENDISNLKLTTICPGAILGPVLEEDFGTSANIVLKMLDGSSPAIPKAGFEIVDVRDVAELHLLALENPKSDGKRLVATSSYKKFEEIADLLRKDYPNKKIPKIVMPDFMVKIMSNFIKEIKPILLELGDRREVSSNYTKEVLNWKPRSANDSIIACSNSIINLKLV